jgi:hypothetical protein
MKQDLISIDEKDKKVKCIFYLYPQDLTSPILSGFVVNRENIQ